jgi:hypothetical protein
MNEPSLKSKSSASIIKLFWLKVSKVSDTLLDNPLASVAFMTSVISVFCGQGILTFQFVLLPV